MTTKPQRQRPTAQKPTATKKTTPQRKMHVSATKHGCGRSAQVTDTAEVEIPRPASGKRRRKCPNLAHGLDTLTWNCTGQ